MRTEGLILPLARIELHDPVGLGERAAHEPHRVDKAEHRRVQPDAHSEHEDGGRGEPGRTGQLPDRDFQVAGPSTHRFEASLA
jgi:hypothetical protein